MFAKLNSSLIKVMKNSFFPFCESSKIIKIGIIKDWIKDRQRVQYKPCSYYFLSREEANKPMSIMSQRLSSHLELQALYISTAFIRHTWPLAFRTMSQPMLPILFRYLFYTRMKHLCNASETITDPHSYRPLCNQSQRVGNAGELSIQTYLFL